MPERRPLGRRGFPDNRASRPRIPLPGNGPIRPPRPLPRLRPREPSPRHARAPCLGTGGCSRLRHRFGKRGRPAPGIVRRDASGVSADVPVAGGINPPPHAPRLRDGRERLAPPRPPQGGAKAVEGTHAVAKPLRLTSPEAGTGRGRILAAPPRLHRDRGIRPGQPRRHAPPRRIGLRPGPGTGGGWRPAEACPGPRPASGPGRSESAPSGAARAGSGTAPAGRRPRPGLLGASRQPARRHILTSWPQQKAARIPPPHRLLARESGKRRRREELRQLSSEHDTIINIWKKDTLIRQTSGFRSVYSLHCHLVLAVKYRSNVMTDSLSIILK
jgi:hypothetical protein